MSKPIRKRKEKRHLFCQRSKYNEKVSIFCRDATGIERIMNKFIGKQFFNTKIFKNGKRIR